MNASLPISIDHHQLAEICRAWNIDELSVFGSVLRDDFRSTSDVDMLVTFADGRWPSLFGLARLQQALEQLLGRQVDLIERSSVEASPRVGRKQAILSSRRVLYAA